ncbi:helix-turn-helix domain-containing protein [Leptospira interrogans]
MDIRIGERIKQRRIEIKISQTELARRVGVTRIQMLKYESGENRLSATRLYQISQVLGVPIQWFFEGSGIAKLASDDQYPSDIRMQQDLKAAFEVIEQPHLKALLIRIARQMGPTQALAKT